jgi:hypothetical protein
MGTPEGKPETKHLIKVLNFTRDHIAEEIRILVFGCKQRSRHANYIAVGIIYRAQAHTQDKPPE